MRCSQSLRVHWRYIFLFYILESYSELTIHFHLLVFFGERKEEIFINRTVLAARVMLPITYDA